MMLSRDYRTTARNALRGFWGTSILVALVAGLLGATGNSIASAGGSGASSNSSGETPAALSTAQLDAIPPVILGIAVAVLSLMAVYALVALIIGGAVRLGLVSYNMDLITRQNPPAFKTLFSRFNIFGKAFALQFMISLFIILWALAGIVPMGILMGILIAVLSTPSNVPLFVPLVAPLFLIPAVIAVYRYALAPYLMAASPTLGVMESIRLSKQMMKGNKWRLFKLYFSFIGWALLGILTLGIGYLWLNPYIFASEAAFCLDIMRNNNQAGQQPNAPVPEM